MSLQENNIKPDKITKPIQLLAAWLLGLILLVSALLTAAGTIKSPTWLPGFLAISAVSIIPLFLLLIFLLQTKYRPEMQEDTYYSKYLDRNTMTFEYVSNKDVDALQLENTKGEILQLSTETRRELEIIRKMIEKDKPNIKNEEAIETLIQKSDDKLEELKRIAKFSNINLKINKRLHTYAEIVEAIKKIGFTKFQEFGTNEVPRNFVIAMGKKVPIDIAKELIFDLIPLGAQYIKVTQQMGKDESTNRDYTIFIGSYLIHSSNIPINQEFIDKVNSLSSDALFEDVISS